jgi:flavin-dependent dehydrogenase
MPSAIVIGAGPAGSVAAFVLAKAGWQVNLVEQHRFPRDKVCGECISALGVACLERLGLFNAICRAGAVPLRTTILHGASGSSTRIELPHQMWGLSRHLFDATLLDAARAAGSTILQPARFEGFENSAIRIRDLESNEIRTLQADRVIIADGKPPKRRWRDFGIKAHFEGMSGPGNAIELFGCQGLYGGLAPIENDRWNVAFSVPAKRLKRFNGDVDAMFAKIRSDNRTLNERLTGATRITRWLSSPLPRFRTRALLNPNIVRIGNAAAALEPIGGEGMGLAMTSAEQAANAVIDDKLDLLDSQYKILWRTRQLACRLAALVVSRPSLLRPSILLLRPSTPIPRFSLALIGK